MALCDVFTILFPGPGIIYMFTFGQHSKPLGPEIMCYLYTFFNETFPSMVSFYLDFLGFGFIGCGIVSYVFNYNMVFNFSFIRHPFG